MSEISKYKSFLFKLKWLVLAVILFCFYYFIDWPELFQTFRHLTWPLAIILILISFILVGISTSKWQLFLKANQQAVSWLKLFKLYLVGYFANSFLPSFVGGDLWRSYLVNGKKEMSSSIAATIMERFTGFLAMAVLAVIGLPFVKNISAEIGIAVLFISGLIIISVFFLRIRLLSRIKNFLPTKFKSKLINLEAGLAGLLFQKKLFVQTFALSLLFHLVVLLNVYFAALAVGWTAIPLLDTLIILPLIMILAAIPLTPNGLGITEGAFVFFLGALGASPEEGLAIALIFRLKTYLLGIIGVFWLGMLKDKN